MVTNGVYLKIRDTTHVKVKMYLCIFFVFLKTRVAVSACMCTR